MSAIRHFVDLVDVPARDLRRMIDDARAMKAKRLNGGRPLAGKTLAMIFERPSTRTRVSFEVGMRQLGGDVIMLTAEEMQLGRGETIGDTARVLSRYVDVIMIRALDADGVVELARHATVPVINGLTRRSHPCQVLADVMTFEEHRGPIRGRTVAWTGDANNVLTSWMHAAERFAFQPARRHAAGAGAEETARRVGQILRGRDYRRHRPRRGREGRRLHRHRHLGVDGRPQRRPPSQSAAALSGQCAAHGASEAGRHLHALPARASRRGGHRRGDGRPAFGGVRRGREPPARAEGDLDLVPGGEWPLSRRRAHEGSQVSGGVLYSRQ